MTSSRRRFLRTASAAVSAPFILPSKVWAQGPSKKLAHAAIGITGQAGSDIAELTASGRLEVVAIAEVDKRHHAAAKAKFPNAVIFQDWREMFDKAGDTFESVNISIPDHMHAAVALRAFELKKHVYCQKPLTRTLAEAHALRDAARKAGTVTQMGNQIQSSSEYRTAAKMVREGAIGKVKEIHCWVGTKFPQPPRPPGADPVPEGLDWNLWLGVAPERPYKEGLYAPFQWRGWQDFGCGAIGDFACHIMDTPYKALNLSAPVSVECTGAEQEWLDNEARNRESWPAWETFRYEFAGNDLTADKILPVYWYDGGKKPDPEQVPVLRGRNIPGSGALFVGEEASLLLVHYGGRPMLLPAEKDRAYRPSYKPVPGSPSEHYSSYVAACLGEGKTTSHFEFAVPLTEAACLGAVAARFHGKKLAYDSAKLEFPGNPEATKLAKPAYRQGWNIGGF